MEQPLHTLRPPTAAQATPSRAFGIGVVIAIHAAVILALIAGLNQQLLQKLPSELVAKVEETPPPPVKLPPPPPPDLVKPPPPFVPPPDINITAEAPVTNTITMQNQVATPPPKEIGITAPASIGRPHSCGQRYYPAIAVRLNQQGTTVIAFKITTEGTVKDLSIAQSSGYDSLDQAAITCAQGWEYKPAMQSGAPVEVPWKTSVKWSLSGG